MTINARNVNRREAFQTLGLTAAAVASGVLTVSNAQGAVGSKLVTVGEGGDFSTIQEALGVAAARASFTSPYVVFLLPGIYAITSPFTLPQWVTLAGAHRKSVEILLKYSVAIGFSSNSGVSDITFRYTGSGAALVSSERIENFELTRATFIVKGAGAAVHVRHWVANAWFYDLLLVTEGLGFMMTGGGFFWIYNTHVALVGTDTGTLHCGYFLSPSNYVRMWLYGGMLGSGYGYPNVSDPDQDVIGVYCGRKLRGRVHMHDIWGICRNERPGSGVVNCVRNDSVSDTDAVIVRVFGCYFQAETGDGSGVVNTIFTDGLGRFETHGSRIREFGESQAFGGAQTGVSRYSTADDGAGLRQESGGLILLDASQGPFTLTLSGGWVLEGEQYIFKKADSSGNAITIRAGRDWTIEGGKEKRLSSPYQTLHLRAASRTWWIT